MLHLAAFPWFAYGHISSFIHLSNKLAERGCRMSIFIPTNTSKKLAPLNLFPHLVNFIPVDVPHVEGLPTGAETMSDAIPDVYLLIKAFVLTKGQVQNAIQNLHPHAIFFDIAHWLPTFAHSLGIRCIYFSTVNIPVIAPLFLSSPAPLPSKENEELVGEATDQCKEENSYQEIMAACIGGCDAICFKGYPQLYGHLSDQIKAHLKKPVFFVGTNLPEPSKAPLEERWEKWLGSFEKGSVVYCAFGSECVLEKDQFQELLLGLELTGLPFLARLKPPKGVETLEEGLPDGFHKRVGGRGVVHAGWVQQHQILNHPSVGCFVTHCGAGSMWESLITSTCQIVLIPHIGDQFGNANYLANELKVGVEVERREEDKRFTMDGVSKAVKLVMDERSGEAQELRANHHKWREFLSTKGLQTACIDNVLVELEELIKSK